MFAKHRVFLAVLVTSVLLALTISSGDSPPRPISPPSPDSFTPPVECSGPPPAEPGWPRPWESSIPITTYGTLNVRNGNVITVIPVVGWNGVGPDIEFNLYHNSASVGDVSTLGAGWSTSYSDRLIFNGNTTTVVADDGTRDAYTYSGGQWNAPPGIHDVLTQTGNTWKLTHKDQSYHWFDNTGRLTSIVDETNHSVNLLYTEIVGILRPTQIFDTSGRYLQLSYDDGYNGLPNGVGLVQIFDPKESGESGDEHSVPDRTWTIGLTNGSSARFTSLTDSLQPPRTTTLVYDLSGRISQLTDRKLV